MLLLMTSCRAVELKGSWLGSCRQRSTPAIQSSISSRPSCTLSERVSVICSFSFRSLTDADRSSYLPTMSSSPKEPGNVNHSGFSMWHFTLATLRNYVGGGDSCTEPIPRENARFQGLIQNSPLHIKSISICLSCCLSYTHIHIEVLSSFAS